MTDTPVRHGRRTPSLRAQVLAVALVPSLLLLTAGLVGSGFLLGDATEAQTQAGVVADACLRLRLGRVAQEEAGCNEHGQQQEARHQRHGEHLATRPEAQTQAGVVADATGGVSVLLPPAVAEERRLSLLAVSGDSTDALTAARQAVDTAYAGLRQRLDALEGVGQGQELTKDAAAVRDAADELAGLRRSVDAARAERLTVANGYGTLQDAALELVAAAGPRSAAEEATQSRSDAEILLRAADELARGVALAVAAHPSGGLTPTEQTWFAQQLGVYDSELGQLAGTRLDGDGDTRLAALRQSRAVTVVETLEEAVAAAPAGDTAAARATPVDVSAYRDAATEVVTALYGLGDNELAVAAQRDAALTSAALQRAVLIAVVLVALGVAVLVAAFRVANRIVRRLAHLRDGTLRRAREELPTLVAGLRAGAKDGSAALPPLDTRDDEIGQVAAAFEIAQQTAVDAAAAEASARAGFGAVFLNIAHRSQGIVHRQLRTIDEAERAESDPDQLARLFRLDHLATRERRNAENLIILGGGQPGRQWRDPVGLLDVVRGAVSEAVQYDRVTIGRMPPLGIIGGGVADLVHLLAELLDNAISFSPPDSRIEVRANAVGRGLVIEVEDQGLGVEAEQREQLNAMLAEPAEFAVLDLSEDSRLGLFVVARLAHRQEIRVTLLESAFGGVRAVVLVPAPLLVVEPAAAVAAADPATAVRRTPAPARAAERGAPSDGAASPGTPGGAAAVNGRATLAAVAVAEPPTLAGPRPDPDRPSLPRRRRQDALAPRLAHAPEAGPEDVPDAEDDGGAERSRSVLGDLQRRTREARADEEQSDDGE